MKKIDKIVDKVLSIGIRKWLLCNLLIFAFELIYCDINICEYDLTWLKVFWTCLFCYSPVIQAKLNIFTGANESMVGYKAWEKYMSLIVGIRVVKQSIYITNRRSKHPFGNRRRSYHERNTQGFVCR